MATVQLFKCPGCKKHYSVYTAKMRACESHNGEYIEDAYCNDCKEWFRVD